jgi:hypothetical protein
MGKEIQLNNYTDEQKREQFEAALKDAIHDLQHMVIEDCIVEDIHLYGNIDLDFSIVIDPWKYPLDSVDREKAGKTVMEILDQTMAKRILALFEQIKKPECDGNGK